MTTKIEPMCLTCVHYKSWRKCDAFPDGIPDAIYWEYADHRQQFEGDNGIRFQIAAEYAEFEDDINKQYDKEG